MNTSKSTGIFLDSSVILNAIVETELTEFADKVFEQFPLITSETVIDESVYVIIRKLFTEMGVKNRFDIKISPGCRHIPNACNHEEVFTPPSRCQDNSYDVPKRN